MRPISESRERTVEARRSAVSLLFYLITASGVVIGFVFFVGWAYAYHYFAHFKLGLLALKLPVVTYLGFSFWVFQVWWWLLIPYVLWIAVLALREPQLSPWLERIKRDHPLSLKHLQVLVVLLAFLLAWWLASISAGWYYQAQQANHFSDLPLVSVWPNAPTADETLRELYGELPEGSYRLLLEDRDMLFLFKPPSPGKPVPVIELPWKEVRLVRVLP